MPRVSAVIPNWNGARVLPATLESLNRQDHPLAEVLVIDNGSADGSAAAASAQGARVIALDRNFGFTVAVNAGIQNSDAEWIAIINNDVELQPNWLSTLLAAAEQSGAWFACGKLLDAGRPARIDGAFDAVCRGGCAWRCGHGRSDGAAWNEKRSISFPSFTAGLFRAELFQAAGLLDEDYESYLEDVDFGIRCSILGYRGVYVPEAAARHRGSATLGRWHPETVRRIARNQVLLVAKHYPASWPRQCGWAVLVAQSLWGFVALRHGAGGAFLKGKWQGVRAFPGCRRAGSNGVFDILAASERQIYDLQRETGFDSYWRLYFALT